MANVLVVEDDADSLEVVARLVERAGHNCIRAANGWAFCKLASWAWRKSSMFNLPPKSQNLCARG